MITDRSIGILSKNGICQKEADISELQVTLLQLSCKLNGNTWLKRMNLSGSQVLGMHEK